MTGRRNALLIATSRYQDQRFQRLIAPLNDVKALGSVLGDSNLGDFAVSTISNKDAHVVMETIEGFCAERTPDDIALLYFSCHGYTSDSGDLFLVARNTNKDKLFSTGVPDSFLRTVLRRCRASTRILILDCCFGGAFNTGLLAKGDADTVNIKAAFAEIGSGLVVLTASNARESAFEEVGDGRQRKSVFTRTLVDGISTGDADLDGDGLISADDLANFASRRIVTNSSRQTPTITTIGVQGMIVLSRAKPRPAATNLQTVPLDVAPNRRLDLRPWVRVHDTGTDAANAAVAAVTAMETNLAYHGVPISLSARYIYQKAKQLARLAPDDQSGISMDVMRRVLTEFGTVPDSVWPYRAGDWKLPKGTSQTTLDTAAATYRAVLQSVRSRHELIDELNRGRPVLSAFKVFESTWMTTSMSKMGVIEPPKPDEQELGTVAVAIVDVDEAQNILRFAHTWGPSWGDHGFGTMSFEAAQTLLVFNQMWSVEVERADQRPFDWGLTEVRAASRVGLPYSVEAQGEAASEPAPTPRPSRTDAEPAVSPSEAAPIRRARPSEPPKPSPDGLVRIVYDGRLLGASYASLDPATVLRQDGDEVSADSVANQVFEALGAFHACMKDAFGRNSWDDRGAPYRAIVHYGRDFNNAFWDGGPQVVVLGDGDGLLMTGFYSLDVVAKEFGNAVMSRMTPLIYEGQSGALFHGLSIVIASMVKQHAAQQTATEADWLLAPELLAKGVKGKALRDLLHPGTAYDDPGLGKDPTVGHMDQFVRSTQHRQGDIYINAGIPARAFALAATALGGPSWQRVGHAWYQALQSPKLTSRATFASFAGLTVAAAGDHDVVEAIRAAWGEVGVRVPMRHAIQ